MKMKQKDHIKYWVESAQHDIESAESIFASGRYDWCLFVGHLALEKMLKALFVQSNKNTMPPKLHNLVRLAELSGVTLDENQTYLLDKINDFNIQTRYPDYNFNFYKKCDKNFAKEYLEKIKTFFKWFKSLIT